MDNMINSTVFGNWKVTELIGEGGFGKVYKIEREDFGIHNVAALKVLTVPGDSSEEKELENDGLSREETEKYLIELVEDTVREVALMCELKGEPNVVGYEDHYVEKVDGSLKWNIFIRMEYLTPMSIYFKENVLNTKTALKLACDICTALETCHENRIIHRDIKPENIFVSRNGDFKLGDFGIARTMEKTVGAFSKKGTYSYMAPEVYSGKDYSDNVDVYSLGLLLYRLFNKNKLPFTALDRVSTYAEREQALLKRMSGAELPAPVEANEDLSQIILKACAFDPEKRYKNASEMKSDILFLIENKTAERTTGPFSMPGFKKEITVTEETLTNEEFESEQEKTFGPAYKDFEIPTEVSEEEYEWQEDDEKKLSLKKLLIPVAVLVLLLISVFAVSRLNKNKVEVKPDSTAVNNSSENVTEGASTEKVSEDNKDSESKATNNSKQSGELNNDTTTEIPSSENSINKNNTIATQDSEKANSNINVNGLSEGEFSIEGDCGDKGSNVKWSLNTTTGELKITGTGDMKECSFDESLWYGLKDSIKKVVIGNGVTSIGDYAFKRCENLVSVDISDSVTRIGDVAFGVCTSITSITIPKNVESIGNYAFLNCLNLSSIDVSSENKVFYNDEYGVLFDKKMGKLVQYPTGNNRTSYAIPNDVLLIEDHAFANCKNLTSVTISNGVEEIFLNAFYNCESLENIVIPKSVKIIGFSAFYNCENLETIRIDNPNCEICDDDSTITPTAKIYAYPNSTAHNYAKEYNRKFVAL